MPNQMRIDPSRTTTLRKRFMADMQRRFRSVEKANTELIVENDALGLITSEPISFNVDNVERQVWRFRTNPKKLKAYKKWLQDQIDAKILTTIGGISDKPWTAEYVESAYRKGYVRAYTDIFAEELASTPEFYAGGKAQFLRDAFNQPVALSQMELLSTRAFTELEGVTATMSQQLSRHLANGLAQGHSVSQIALNMTKAIAGLSRGRALTIARTEIIASHAEGQLDSFEKLGVEEVGIWAEWSTAGDERVCPWCNELEGVVMTIKEARGLIPRHPNCRCVWLPADRTRKKRGQLWDKAGKQAVDKSIQAEAPQTIERTKKAVRRRSVWAGKKL